MNTIDVALICKSLSEANRLQIIDMLADGERCACELLDNFEISQSTLSYHMRMLIDSGLVETRKDGKWSHYRINCATLNAFKKFVNDLSCTPNVGEHSCE